MEEYTKPMHQFFVYIDRITKPIDILLCMIMRYTGQIFIVIGIIKFSWEIVILGSVLYGVYVLNQTASGAAQAANELRKIHQHLEKGER